jgi:hypothetical protein
MSTLDLIEKAANLWNQTKDPKYKEQWYKRIEEWNERNRTLLSPVYHPSGQRCYKRSDRFNGTYYASRLFEHGPED